MDGHLVGDEVNDSIIIFINNFRNSSPVKWGHTQRFHRAHNVLPTGLCREAWKPNVSHALGHLVVPSPPVGFLNNIVQVFRLLGHHHHHAVIALSVRHFHHLQRVVLIVVHLFRVAHGHHVALVAIKAIEWKGFGFGGIERIGPFTVKIVCIYYNEFCSIVDTQRETGDKSLGAFLSPCVNPLLHCFGIVANIHHAQVCLVILIHRALKPRPIGIFLVQPGAVV